LQIRKYTTKIVFLLTALGRSPENRRIWWETGRAGQPRLLAPILRRQVQRRVSSV